MKELWVLLFPVLVLILAAMVTLLLSFRQARRIETSAQPVRDGSILLLAALLLIGFLSLGFFAFVLIFA
jgi:hypothetical protein